jgi:hypothetical protein
MVAEPLHKATALEDPLTKSRVGQPRANHICSQPWQSLLPKVESSNPSLKPMNQAPFRLYSILFRGNDAGRVRVQTCR